MEKMALIKQALANRKRNKKTNKTLVEDSPAEEASENGSVEAQENTPGVKKGLELKGRTNKSAKSRVPFWVKQEGTPENPGKGKVLTPKGKKTPSFFTKAKTRGGN